jgi:hypothetical protein
MKAILILSALAAATLSPGCATNEPAAATEAMAQREYPTGSNIPRKRAPGDTEGVSAYDKAALERARDEQYQTQRPGLGRTQ